MGKANFNDYSIKDEKIIDENRVQGNSHSTINKPLGRPKVSVKERRSVPLNILLTQSEHNQLMDKAGLVNKGAFVRACLKELGIFK